MSVFKVMISEKTAFGYRRSRSSIWLRQNEYVWADSEDNAIIKAKKKVQARVRRRSGIKYGSNSPLDLYVGEVEDGYSWWSLLKNDTFAFFDVATWSEE